MYSCNLCFIFNKIYTFYYVINRLVTLFRQTATCIDSSSNFSALAECIVEHLLADR